MKWEAFKTAAWGFMLAMVMVNTWLTHERIQSQRELNGNVVALKALVQKLGEQP